MIKAVVFDCFGVLLADVLRTRAAELADKDPEAAEAIYAALQRMDKGLINEEKGMQEIAAALQLSYAQVVSFSKEGERRNQPLLKAIHELKPRYKIGLLSNVHSIRWLHSRFLPGEIDTLFDAAIASGEVGIVKPDPAIYHLITDQLGVLPAETIMIDDSARSCQGAQDAGLNAILYENNQQCLSELHTLLTSVDN